MRGLFVTATDTGVGKTVVCAALLAAMAADGERVRAYKPVITGLEDPVEITARGDWPADHELLAAIADMTAEEVSPLRYGPALAPQLAAQLAGAPIQVDSLIAHARALAGAEQERVALVVEGVGGLLVPLRDDYSVRDLAADLALPLLVVARPGLGTINHTLLTLESARQAGLSVAAVVLTPWPAAPSKLERSNRETIERLGGVEATTMGLVHGPDRASLAAAGSALDWEKWL